jgi:hypothetical protein
LPNKISVKPASDDQLPNPFSNSKVPTLDEVSPTKETNEDETNEG